MTQMKALAPHLCTVVWWLKLDVARVKQCDDYQQNQITPFPVLLHPWQYLNCPWTELYIGLAGPVVGKMLLIVVDSCSRLKQLQ